MTKHQSSLRVNKRNAIAADLRTPKYRLRVIPSKKTTYTRKGKPHAQRSV
jgi:hypothetical protein